MKIHNDNNNNGWRWLLAIFCDLIFLFTLKKKKKEVQNN